jgi:hypothetical protein
MAELFESEIRIERVARLLSTGIFRVVANRVSRSRPHETSDKPVQIDKRPYQRAERRKGSRCR